MTPRDRLQNRYLVNFFDHKTNYCQIFLVITKDAAAKLFEHFLASLRSGLTAASTSCAQTRAASTRTSTCSARARE